MIKNILFDFDGVIIDSLPIRTHGLRKTFSEYNNKQVDKLIIYHQLNGGVSRFQKIKYFYSKILKKNVSEKIKREKALIFSKLVTSKLCDKNLLIKETINFIKKNYKKFNLHIVSASEQNELRFICKYLKIDKYFNTIIGSPKKKDVNINNIINVYKYKRSETVLIGDAINDYDAAIKNNIFFIGFNNDNLKKIQNIKYIEKFKNIFKILNEIQEYEIK